MSDKVVSCDNFSYLLLLCDNVNLFACAFYTNCNLLNVLLLYFFSKKTSYSCQTTLKECLVVIL